MNTSTLDLKSYELAFTHVKLIASEIFDRRYDEAKWWLDFTKITPHNIEAYQLFEQLKGYVNVHGIDKSTEMPIVHQLINIKELLIDDL